MYTHRKKKEKNERLYQLLQNGQWREHDSVISVIINDVVSQIVQTKVLDGHLGI